MFWDAATFGLIKFPQSTSCFWGILLKIRDAASSAPHLDQPTVISTEPGDHPTAVAEEGVDLYALTHNDVDRSFDASRATGRHR